MRTFNYAWLRDRKWDTDLLGLIAAIYKEAGKQELFFKQQPAKNFRPGARCILGCRTCCAHPEHGRRNQSAA